MKTRTILLGVAGMATCGLAYLGKVFDVTGSNELLVIGTGLLIFGFLLSSTLHFFRLLDVSILKRSGWIGFVGGSSIILGIMFTILKYFVPALLFYALGGILLIISFLIFTIKIRSLVS